MPHLSSSQVHLRGLVVIALALAAAQVVGMTRVHAQDASARTYDALAAGRSSSLAATSPSPPSPNACDDGTGTGIDDTICGSITGGPAGGNGS